MDSAVSPPLSDIEVADIEASESEFSTEEVRIYENIESLILGLLTISRIRPDDMDFTFVPDHEAQIAPALHNPSTLDAFSS